MSLKPEEIDDLLNGMLDGVLEDDEQRRLNAAMASDPSLQARLDEMAALRRSLLRGRSVGRLGPDFAKGIIAAARERADLMDHPPEWIKLSTAGARDSSREGSRSSRVATSRERPMRKEPVALRPLMPSNVGEANDAREVFTQRAWRVWLPGLVTVSAACVGLLILSTFWPSDVPQDIAKRGELPTVPADDTPSVTDALPRIVANPTVEPSVSSNGSARDPVVPNNSNIAAADASTEKEPNAAAIAMDPSVETAPALDPKMPAADAARIADASTPKQEVGEATPGEVLLDEIRNSLSKQGLGDKPFFAVIVDVAATADAIDSQVVEGLFEKYEVAYSKNDDMVLDRDQLEVMTSKNLVGSVPLRDRDAPLDENVSVFFLRASNVTLDSLLDEIIVSTGDFPSFKMDLSMDPSVVGLVKQLDGVVEGSAVASARRLAYRGSDNNQLVSMFPGVVRGQGMPMTAREQLAEQRAANSSLNSDRGMSNARRATSNLVLIVRPAKDL